MVWLDRLLVPLRALLAPRPDAEAARGGDGAMMPVVGAMLTHPGRVRENNEDSVAYTMPGAVPVLLAVVADGMGGHAAGEVASALATSTLTRAFHALPGGIPRRLAAAIDAANTAIRQHVAGAPETEGMGATCTALAVTENAAWLGHVGDSRAYLVRDREARQLSQDHSLIAEQLRRGEITEDEARDSPNRGVILRALGIAAKVEPDVWTEGMSLRDGDVFVLCSDGLSDLVGPAEIARLTAEGEPEECCRALIEAALAGGGHDNISVGVFFVGERLAPEAVPVTREIEVPDTLRLELPGTPAPA